MIEAETIFNGHFVHQKLNDFNELLDTVKAYVAEHPNTVISNWDPIDFPEGVFVPNDWDWEGEGPTTEQWLDFLNNTPSVAFHWGYSASEGIGWTVPASALKDVPEAYKREYLASAEGNQALIATFYPSKG